MALVLKKGLTTVPFLPKPLNSKTPWALYQQEKYQRSHRQENNQTNMIWPKFTGALCRGWLQGFVAMSANKLLRDQSPRPDHLTGYKVTGRGLPREATSVLEILYSFTSLFKNLSMDYSTFEHYILFLLSVFMVSGCWLESLLVTVRGDC